ncbi:MAG: S24 family peptidase [Bacteriovorax sp.]|nr:S24 family peptidase [Bacteriovorax sp.]
MGNNKNDFFNFGKALKEYRLNAGMSQEELALNSELDRTYISMLERNLKTPTLTTLVKISRSLSISPSILLARALQIEKASALNAPTKKEKYKPPFFGTAVSCGLPVGQDHYIEKEMSLDEYNIKNPEKTFFLKAAGDSMSPTIWSGDLLIIELNSRPRNNDLVLVQIDNEFTVKRFFKTAKGIKLIPDNPLFKEITLQENNNLIICGIIKGISRFFT